MKVISIGLIIAGVVCLNLIEHAAVSEPVHKSGQYKWDIWSCFFSWLISVLSCTGCQPDFRSYRKAGLLNIMTIRLWSHGTGLFFRWISWFLSQGCTACTYSGWIELTGSWWRWFLLCWPVVQVCRRYHSGHSAVTLILCGGCLMGIYWFILYFLFTCSWRKAEGQNSPDRCRFYNKLM